MENLKTPGNSPRTPRLFYLILLAIPVVFFLSLEAGFRLFSAGDEIRDPYVSVSPFSIFSKETVDGVEFARITHRYARANSDTRFAVRKPENTVRVFILGGSAAAGWPHKTTERFSAYLQQTLQAALPQRKVEVINAAMHGFASFRVRHVFDELVDMDPDALLIYSGNNEFLEKREYPVMETFDTLADHSAALRWLRSQVLRLKSGLPADDLQDVALFFWKKVKRQSLELRQDAEQFEKVQEHYRHTMGHMALRAKEKAIPLLLCTVPVNLRDWLPTVSHNSLSATALKEWQSLYDLGRKQLLKKRYAEGIDAMERAIALAPEHAESYFWLGRLLEASGRFPEALQSYSRSRDLDYNPFRAVSAFNHALRSIAQKSEGIMLVDLEKAFEEHSGTGIPGFELFLDYVHPNTQGNILIAKEVFRVMSERSVLPEKLNTTLFSQGNAALAQGEKAYDDALDADIQTRLFGLYAMDHQYAAAIANARHLVRLETGKELTRLDAEALNLLPRKIREGYTVFTRYEKAERDALLGHSNDPAEMDAAKKMLEAYYEEWFPYGKY